MGRERSRTVTTHRTALLVMLTACGGAGDSAQSKQHSPASIATVTVSPTADAAAPQVSNEVASLLARARAHARALDWRASTADLEQAARIAPSNPVVLGELTWSALNVRDLARADQVARAALALAAPPAVRAQILYNAGRVAQALGDVARAGAHYDASLALRPNDEVSEQRRSLTPSGQLSGVNSDPSDPCPSGRSVPAVAACLDSTLRNANPSSPKRAHRVHKANADYVIFEVGSEDVGDSIFTGAGGEVVLYRTTPRGLERVGRLGWPGASAKYAMASSFSLQGTTEQVVAGHRVVLVAWSTSEGGYCGGCSGGVEVKYRFTTLCLPASGTCPVQAIVERESTLSPVNAEVEPWHTVATFGVRIADDGTVTTTLHEGTAAAAGAEGGHAKLW